MKWAFFHLKLRSKPGCSCSCSFPKLAFSVCVWYIVWCGYSGVCMILVCMWCGYSDVWLWVCVVCVCVLVCVWWWRLVSGACVLCVRSCVRYVCSCACVCTHMRTHAHSLGPSTSCMSPPRLWSLLMAKTLLLGKHTPFRAHSSRRVLCGSSAKVSDISAPAVSSSTCFPFKHLGELVTLEMGR